MAEIDVERQTKPSVPWWIGVVGLLALLLLVLIVGLVTTDTDTTPAELGAGPDMDVGAMELGQVLDETGMSDSITYGGRTYEAVEAGRFDQTMEADLIAIGPSIGDNPLYYEQGTPTNPYETLYLRATEPGYEDVYVRYELQE